MYLDVFLGGGQLKKHPVERGEQAWKRVSSQQSWVFGVKFKSFKADQLTSYSSIWCYIDQKETCFTVLAILLEKSKYPRFVLKGPCYNPMDVINALMTRRGYKVLLIMLMIFDDMRMDDDED